MDAIIPTQILPPKVQEEKAPDLSQELRSVLATQVKENAADIIGAQIEMARGVWIKEFVKDKNGEYKMDDDGRPITKVYLRAPSESAGQYLLNQVVGKPKENTVIEGKVNFVLDL